MWDVESEMGLLAIRALGQMISIMQNKKEREVCLSVEKVCMQSSFYAGLDILLSTPADASTGVNSNIHYVINTSA